VVARSEKLVLEIGHATDAQVNEREREEVRASWAGSNDVQRWCGVLKLGKGVVDVWKRLQQEILPGILTTACTGLPLSFSQLSKGKRPKEVP
jgi:hypothetical protein